MPTSLRAELLTWLLVPLAGIVVFNGWAAHRNAETIANLMTDRMLPASARVIAEQVKEQDGRVNSLIPPSALEMFASPDRDRAIYRVVAPSGELIAGFPDVPEPGSRPADLQPVYFDASFRTKAIRAVALVQPVISKEFGGNALVAVGTTLNSRDRLLRDLWLPSLRDKSLLVAAAALLDILGLARGLTPLLRLRSELRTREASSLAPLRNDQVQSELTPFIEALNPAFARSFWAAPISCDRAVRRALAAGDRPRRFVEADGLGQLTHGPLCPGLGGVELHRLGEPDRPGDDRGEGETGHDRLHDDVGRHEHAPGGQIVDGRGHARFEPPARSSEPVISAP